MTTLVLIDLQRGMCDPKGAAGAAGLADAVAEAHVLDRAAGALATARRSGAEVVHVRLAFTSRHRNRTNATARFRDHEDAGRFLAGSFDTEICDEVAPTGDELVLDKGSVSPFASTALLTQLATRGERRIVLAGVATHLAVESAAREAGDRGLEALVLADACVSPSADLHRHSIEQIIPAFGTVISSEDLEEVLSTEKGTPR